MNDPSPDDANDNAEDETVRFTFDMPADLHQALKVQAFVHEERSMKDIANEAVELYLKINQ